MIITKKTKIIINKQNISKYNKILNKNLNIDDIIFVDIENSLNYKKIKVDVKCDNCQNMNNITYYSYLRNIKNYDFYLCKKCCYLKTKKTNLEKYGVEYSLQSKEIRNKLEKTNLERYGVKNTFQSEIKKQKIKSTNLERYGVENPQQSKEIRNKSKKTNLKKYGVKHPSQSDIIKDKIKKTNLEKYGVNHPMMIDEIKNKAINNAVDKKNKKIIDNKNNNILKVNNKECNYIILCNKCNKEYSIKYDLYKNRKRINTEICTICNPLNSSKSGLENQLFDFISNNIDVKRNQRKILDNKYELDIYIPDLKLAFEFNGLYWYNELYKDKNYHLNKTELCEKNGIQLIHIYEDDWIYKQDIVKSMILNKLGKTSNKIYARKCEIREITDNKLVREFLDENHIQGFIGSKIKLGLFYENELVNLMTFSKKNIDNGEFVLLRFCNKLNTDVVDGGNELFKYFVRNYNPKKITTYADRSWNQDNLYEQLGFKYEGKTDPNYYYIIDGIRHHRFNFRKDILVKEGYDTSLTEHQIMLNRKIYRIFDSGNLKFKLNSH